MKKTSRRVFLAALMATGLSASAHAETYRSLLIETTDATSPLELLLNPELRLEFTPTEIRVTGVEESFAIPHESFKGMSFSTEMPSSSTDTSQDYTDAVIISDGKLIFSDNISHSVRVTDLSGRLLLDISSENPVINLADLGSGIFIIDINGRSFKITI